MFEQTVAHDLDARGIHFQYEADRLSYTQPAKKRNYLPDIRLDNGIIVEIKGEFSSADRSKHLMIRAENPELDIRFVFERAKTKLRKGSPTTYAAWCEKNNFLWSESEVPQAWVDELPKGVSHE